MEGEKQAMSLTALRLRELLDYDEMTGVFRRKTRSGKRTRPGDVAGCIHPVHGYLYVRVENKQYRAHRLAWLHVYGSWPSDQIDHIDGNRRNNAISNLREATAFENVHNRTATRRNTSGFKGVTWNKNHRKWRAMICSHGHTIYLGAFDRPEDAAEAYRKAALTLHGDYANVGAKKNPAISSGV